MSHPAGDEDRRLRVDFDIDAPADWDCPMVTETDGAIDVAINAVGEACTVELQPDDGGSMIRGRGEVTDDCLCHVFGRFGCVPHVQRVVDGSMLVTTYVEDRTVVRELVDALQGILDRVRLVRLAVVDGPDATEEVSFDLSALTTKQREGLELAVARGYFDDDVELGELATELDISKSALSRRLRTAQAKLVTDVFDAVET